ncbi:hypothetical protein V6N13_123840 [Hibiscus sabdariffa]|uniref:Uncharacterized protein n=1 Tax=Hibiscus sabdariffa TaxID=183260 RepID=A0ABR2QUK3_9ROSI
MGSKTWTVRDVPEETTIVDDTGTIGSSAITDSGHGCIEASQAISRGEVVPTLHHGVHSACFFRGRKISVAAVELLPQLDKGGVEVPGEVSEVGNVVLAASGVQQIQLGVCS